MKRYIFGQDRTQATLLPELLDDYISEENAVRVIDVFVDQLNFHELGPGFYILFSNFGFRFFHLSS